MTQDHSNANPSDADEGREQQDASEGNPFGGSPTFPDPSAARPTGDTTGFNGSYTETEHHTQREYDAEHQQNQSDGDAAAGSDQEDRRS